MKSWLLATRPKTLTAALVPILVGSALAAIARPEGLDWTISLLALASATFIQIGTNLVNDAIDFKKGADNEQRIGPKRVTASGLMTPRQVMVGAGICLFVALLLGIPLVIHGGWPIVAVGLVSLFFAYGYTGGPFPLAYLGLGDLFVLIFFGWVAVGGVYFLQTGTMDTDAWVAGTQVGLLATVLIAVNNLRDREGDLKVGKRTLAVRIGVRGSRIEIALLGIVPFLLGYYWIARGLFMLGLIPLFAAPIAVLFVRQIHRIEPGPEYNLFLAQAAKLHLAFGVLWTIAVAVHLNLTR